MNHDELDEYQAILRRLSQQVDQMTLDGITERNADEALMVMGTLRKIAGIMATTVGNTLE